ALREGEPERVGRGLAMEAGHLSMESTHTQRRVRRLIGQARLLARESNNYLVAAMVEIASGIAAWAHGHWLDSTEHGDRAVQMGLAQMPRRWNFIDSGGIISCWSLARAGSVRALSARLPNLVARAERQGNFLAFTMLRSIILPELAADRPQEAASHLRRSLELWPDDRFYIQHLLGLESEALIGLYLDEAHTALETVRLTWPAMRKSLLLRVQLLRCTMHDIRARLAIAAALQSDRPRPLLRSAQADARRLSREQPHWTQPWAAALIGAVAEAHGDRKRAAESFRGAIEGLQRAGKPLYAAVTKRRLGQLIGGDAGRELVGESEDWMIDEGIQNPERMAAVYLPSRQSVRSGP
ncbi:MAG: hypothetical protein JJ992_20875, partial [Planctomycetes bacterium]|nr:hypothetical protein [Planctomycetota bacterium]